MHLCRLLLHFLFLFDTSATSQIYTLSLHDALPIFRTGAAEELDRVGNSIKYERGDLKALLVSRNHLTRRWIADLEDRKSTRLNSSHLGISYAVFCLKKKK